MKSFIVALIALLIISTSASSLVSAQGSVPVTLSTAAPTPPPTTIVRNWYTAYLNGTIYRLVDFQSAFAAQFSNLGLGVWFMTTYPDPPVYDKVAGGFTFKFCFSSTNVSQRQTAFENYRTSNPSLSSLINVTNNMYGIKIYNIVPSSAPVDTTPAPPVLHQWFGITLGSNVYDTPHFSGCLTQTLQALSGCVVQTDPDSPQSVYDSGSQTMTFKFGFYGEYYARNQDVLANYLQVNPNFQSLYDNCFDHDVRIKILNLSTTTTPDQFTVPPPTSTPGPGSNNNNNGNNDSSNKPLIPGLANWMSFALIGVISFVVVGVIIFVIMSYCRAQEDDGNVQPANVKFDSRKQAQLSAQELAYQRADVQSA